MFILPFVAILTVFFIILWLSDLFFTLKCTEKKGVKLEGNPLMRALLKARRAHLYIYKALEIVCFTALIWLVSFQNAGYSVVSLLVATGVYSLVVANGMAIYMRISKDSNIPSVVFVLACVAALFFAYLAYTAFANGTDLFASCSKCCEDYAVLKASCASAPVPPTGQTPNSDLNITVPG